MNTHPEDDMPGPAPAKANMVWMLSFADLLSLLLAFFVMLYAMTQTEAGKWQEAAQSLQQRLNPERAAALFDFSSKQEVPQEKMVRALDLDYLVPVLKRKLGTTPELAGVRVRSFGDRVVVSLPGDALFAPSDTRLTEKAKSSVLALAEILGTVDNRIEVVGHAEPGAPTDRQFETGWELSLARAFAVAEALRESGYVGEIPVFGQAAARYQDADPALPEAERRAAARRVDIVLRDEAAR